MTDELISGWTIDTLKYHIKVLLDERHAQQILLSGERDRRMEERFASQNTALAAALRDLERYQGTANEFRATIADNNARFMLRTESENNMRSIATRLDSESKLVIERITGISDRLIPLESRQGHLSISMLISVFSLLVAIGVAFMTLVHDFAK